MKSKPHGSFCTVFDCMDGRTKRVVSVWCKKNLRAMHPDTITIAGADGVLHSNPKELARAISMAKISADKHGATHALIVGHSECAGHPVSDKEHHRSIKKSSMLIKKAGVFKNVTGLFVDVRDGSISVVHKA